MQPSRSRLSWPEEDRTPTSIREIHGFYSYGIAAEVFAVVGVGSFLPVTLEQLARENGVLYSDRTTPCISPTRSTVRMLSSRATDGTRDPDQCIVHLFGSDITTASFAMYTFSAAVLCQAIVLISFSAFADYGVWIKLLVSVKTMLTIYRRQSKATSSYIWHRWCSYKYVIHVCGSKHLSSGSDSGHYWCYLLRLILRCAQFIPSTTSNKSSLDPGS